MRLTMIRVNSEEVFETTAADAAIEMRMSKQDVEWSLARFGECYNNGRIVMTDEMRSTYADCHCSTYH